MGLAPLAVAEEEAEDEAVPLETQQQTAAQQQERLAIYLSHAPHTVNDALASLSNPVQVRFTCPETPLGKDDGTLNGGKRALPEQEMTINVRTEIAAWDATVAQDGDRAGYYQWNFGGSGWDADGAREPLSVTNKLMLNPEGVQARSLYGHVENVLTYYHELLHGQLMIEAMKSDAKWAALFCKMKLSAKENVEFFKPIDAQHARIGPWEKTFRDWLWEEVQRRADAEDDEPWQPYPKKKEEPTEDD
jgi:hypothetical protein